MELSILTNISHKKKSRALFQAVITQNGNAFCASPHNLFAHFMYHARTIWLVTTAGAIRSARLHLKTKAVLRVNFNSAVPLVRVYYVLVTIIVHVTPIVM